MMYELFLNWIGDVSSVDSDVVFIFCAVASLIILKFILEFFKFLMYYISNR